MYRIRNKNFSVGIKMKGAELASIQSLKNGTEYMWQANPQYWGRHSCVLFPNIGAISEGHILIGNEKFPLIKHGFARDSEFNLQYQEESKVSFLLSATPNTLKVYPFSFELEMTYQLIDRTLSIFYRVRNQDQQSIIFSIGAHPAFNCPLLPNEKRSDYSLVFDQNETAASLLINENGLLTGEQKQVLNKSNTIHLIDELFDQDALIFKGLESNKVTLINHRKNKAILNFDFPGFTYLGIWSKNRESPFICIEPWYGVADKVGPKTAFSEKEGVISLGPGKEFECGHQIEILD